MVQQEKKGVSSVLTYMGTGKLLKLTMGCDGGHSYQPRCVNYIINASGAVWEALGVPTDQRGGWTFTGQMHD